jgi:SAM-dependent methyltransferase
MDQHELSVRQFGTSAANYLTSPVHATGADLERLVSVAHKLRPARALDLGCGAGHATFALARDGECRVTAYDPSSEMLAVVAHEAEVRGHKTVDTCVGAAEVLPFGDHTFDFIVTRYSAHHWADVPRALSECARVMTYGGRLVVIDVISPEKPLFDTSLQVIEFLRDASHVRDYRVSEWVAMLRAAGLAEPTVAPWKVPLDFKSWIARIGTSPPRVAALQAVFANLPDEVRDYFTVTEDLSFVIDSAWMETTNSGSSGAAC